MATRRPQTVPRPARSLSMRLLWLAVGFVMVGQVFILVPSLGRAYLDWLATRIEASHLAALALEAAPDQMVGEELEDRLMAGEFDLVAVGRALIGDPDFVKKVEQRDYTSIRTFSRADLGKLEWDTSIVHEAHAAGLG